MKNNFFVSKISSLKLSERFKSVAQGVLEIFEEMYLEGTMCPPGWDRVKTCSSSAPPPPPPVSVRELRLTPHVGGPGEGGVRVKP